MLRITIQQRESEVHLVLEGRLELPLIPELERAFAQERKKAAKRQVVVDLVGLTGVDEAGECSLQRLYQGGATLRYGDVMYGYLVERIALGAAIPLQAPCRPNHSNVTQEFQHKHKEEKESANRDRF